MFSTTIVIVLRIKKKQNLTLFLLFSLLRFFYSQKSIYIRFTCLSRVDLIKPDKKIVVTPQTKDLMLTPGQAEKKSQC